jgi:hypothetical protein
VGGLHQPLARDRVTAGGQTHEYVAVEVGDAKPLEQPAVQLNPPAGRDAVRVEVVVGVRLAALMALTEIPYCCSPKFPR